MAAPLRIMRVVGPWHRLHRAESNALANLLSPEEREAVDRRLGLPPHGRALRVPPTSGPWGGRFAEPHGPGALYLGSDLDTCVAEVAHHHALGCAASIGLQPGARAVFRPMVFQVDADLADATGLRGSRQLHASSDYGPSWDFGRRVRREGHAGVHYRSVRHPEGRCLAIYQNEAVAFIRVDFGAILLEWDGRITQRVG